MLMMSSIVVQSSELSRGEASTTLALLVVHAGAHFTFISYARSFLASL